MTFARRLLLLLSCATRTVAPSVAHDFWIEPSSFAPTLGNPLKIGLRVGHRLDGEPVPRAAGSIARFVIAQASKTSDVPGVDGIDPAGLLRLTTPGLAIVAYESRGQLNELPAERFEAYLREEGLESVALLRRQRGQSAAPGRERFIRCAKSLIAVGGDDNGPYDRAVGMPVEIVPEQNPCTAAVGDTLGLRVLHLGKPLPNARVVIATRGTACASAAVRTDAEGHIRVKLGAAGTWFVQCVHMIESPDAQDADWRSYWASLTFEIP